MNYFGYKNGVLNCENISLKDISRKYSTPLYVYSKKTLLYHLRQLQEAFSDISPLICFSMKSNSNLSICKLLIENGAGLDIVSGGELFKALGIEADPSKIVFAGVGKSKKEIKFAISNNIFLFNVESLPEIKLINKVAEEMDKKVNVSIRVNPNVESHTHNYITTGGKITKFGINFDTTRDILTSQEKFKNLNIKGLHIHIGSQITTSEPFVKSITKIGDFIKKIRKEGIEINYLNIGGGLGVVYKDEKPQTAHEFAKAVLDIIKPLNVKLIMEPGRFIAGNSGILLSKVLYLKSTPVKNFLVVDAGMNDFLRPSLYKAYHKVVPVEKNKKPNKIKVDVVGPICESGDFLAKERELPPMKSGDLIAVMGAGAYGFSMASNYNSRPLPSEVMIDREKTYLIRERQKYKDLIEKENIPEEIL